MALLVIMELVFYYVCCFINLFLREPHTSKQSKEDYLTSKQGNHFSSESGGEKTV